MDGKKVLELINNYTYYSMRAIELTEQIESICDKVTATYGNLAPAHSGRVSSPTEDNGNRRHKLRVRLEEYQKKIRLVERMIEKSGLSDTEKGVMWWLANNGKLQAYARRAHIGRDNVYKIRDRAVKKILAAMNTQNVV